MRAFRRSDMLTEDNDPTKPAGVLDNAAGNVSSSTEASLQHPRNANNGRVYILPNFIHNIMLNGKTLA